MADSQISQCPICKKPAAAAENNPAYPFCGPRCKLIDLGRWLGDKYQIPVDPVDDGDAPPAGYSPDAPED